MLQRLAMLLVLFLLVPDAYIYWVHIQKAACRPWVGLLWWVPTLLLILCFAGTWYVSSDNPIADRQDVVAVLSVLILLLGFSKVAFMLVSLLGHLTHLIVRPIPVRPFTLAGAALALAVAGVIAYGSTLGTSRLQVRQVAFRSPRLPEAFRGYKIVHLSDLHAGSFKNRPQTLERLVQTANAQKPDLILFTGDLVNQQAGELDGLAEILAGLAAPDGVYSVLGNHDYGTYHRWRTPQEELSNLRRLEATQEAMGWTLLKNAHTFIGRGNDSIALIGVENEGRPPFPQRADLPRAMRGVPDDAFQVLMSHDPTHWRGEVLPGTRIDLTLAGHTHGTQFKLWGWSPAQWIYDEWGGLYTEGVRALHVSLGIGYVGLPFRFGAWPDIAVVTLNE